MHKPRIFLPNLTLKCGCWLISSHAKKKHMCMLN